MNSICEELLKVRDYKENKFLKQMLYIKGKAGNVFKAYYF